MKSIFYFILTCVFCMMPGFSIQKTTRNIVLHPIEKNVSPELLTRSGRIISERLKTYNPGESVRVTTGKNQITVQIPNKINVSEIEELLTSKGNPGFYETLTVKEIADLSKNEFKTRPSDARLGCSTFENKQVVDSIRHILKSVNLLSDYKLLWGLKNSESKTCLYAVKTDPALTKADLESVNSSVDKDSQSITIGIKFRPESAGAWTAITTRCLNKPIAIVIDNKVFYTPVVRMPMENGSCEITGNFTKKEVNYFLAIAGNDTLPVNLTLK